MINIYKFINGLNIVPRSDGAAAPTSQGDLAVSSADGNIYYNNGSGIFSLLTTTSPGKITNSKIIVSGTGFNSFVDGTDNTKVLLIDNSGETTGVTLTLANLQTTSQTLNFPNITTTDTLVTQAFTQALTNKTINFASNTFVGTLSITNGGTGQATALAAFNALSPMTTGGDIIYGGASGSALRLANGSSGQVLTSSGTTLAPTWTTPSPGFVNPMTSVGDLIVGGSSGTATRLAIGSSAQVLTVSGGTAVWAPASGGSAPTSIGALDGQSANANGLTIASNVLYAQSADATHPGMVNNTTQSFSGAKTFTTSIATPSLTDHGSGLNIAPSLNQNLTIGSSGSGRIIFNGAEGVDFGQTTTPSNPSSGHNSLYFKSDDFLYSLDNNGVERVIGVNNLQVSYAVFQDQKSSGVDGGTFTAGSWQQRILNTTVASQSWASLSSNQITLAAGTYFISATAPAVNVSENQLRWYNVTDSTTVLLGTCLDAVAPTAAVSTLSGSFTIASTKTFELDHQCSSTEATNGFGLACNFGIEVYATVSLAQVTNGPTTTGFQFFASSQVTTDSTAINVNTFTTFSNSPAFTFTPTITGTYKVYCNAPISIVGGGGVTDNSAIRITNTSGGATLLYESQGYGQAGSGQTNGNTATVQSVYTLTSGISYVFDIQGKTFGTLNLILTGNTGSGNVFGAPFYMFAELCG